MSKDKKEEIYVLVKQVHFGTLRTSVPKGTKIIVNREKGYSKINGVEHPNVNEIDICVKAGYAIPFVEGETVVDSTVRISPRAQAANRKYEVETSVEDNVVGTIGEKDKKEPASSKKPEKMPVLREGDGRTVRGIEVIPSNDGNQSAIEVGEDVSQVMRVINGDDQRVVGIIPKTASEQKKGPSLLASDASEDYSDPINGQGGKIVAVIPSKDSKAETKAPVSGKKLVAKRGTKESAAKAKERAEARKKALAGK